MWRSKKFILIATLIVLLVVGSTAGVVYAQTGKGDEAPAKTLFARVATILGIDQQKLEDAFAQAQSEMQTEALDTYLQKLVDEGKITQDEAQKYKEWWQAKPETPLPAPFGFHRFPGGMRLGGGHGCYGRSAPSNPSS